MSSSDPTEMEYLDRRMLAELGFTVEESTSLLWLRFRYQHGGSDRAPVLRYWWFLRWLVLTGRMEA